jgi:DNA polymerase-3 subunit alpha
MYIDRKKNPANIKYPHPALVEILAPSYGVFLYQEQIMAATRILAGFSYTESDELRSVIGKKKLEYLPKLRKKFVERAGAFGLISLEEAENLFSKFESFGYYAFNFSHSVSYSFTSYITCYLKALYKMEFYASLMSVELHCGQKKGNDEDKLNMYEEEAKKLQIKFLPVDINLSKKDYVIEQENCLRYPIGLLKGCGEEAQKEILSKQPYMSVQDFVYRTKPNIVNNAILEILQKENVLSSFGKPKQIQNEVLVAKAQVVQQNKMARGKNIIPYVPDSICQQFV